MEMGTILRTKTPAIKFVPILSEKMLVFYQQLLGHVRATTLDMHITLKPNLASTLPMEGVTEIITDLNRMTNARQFAPRMIPILLHTWSTNAVFQLNLVLVWGILQGKDEWIVSKLVTFYVNV